MYMGININEMKMKCSRVGHFLCVIGTTSTSSSVSS